MGPRSMGKSIRFIAWDYILNICELSKLHKQTKLQPRFRSHVPDLKENKTTPNTTFPESSNLKHSVEDVFEHIIFLMFI